MFCNCCLKRKKHGQLRLRSHSGVSSLTEDHPWPWNNCKESKCETGKRGREVSTSTALAGSLMEWRRAKLEDCSCPCWGREWVWGVNVWRPRVSSGVGSPGRRVVEPALRIPGQLRAGSRIPPLHSLPNSVTLEVSFRFPRKVVLRGRWPAEPQPRGKA